jgi:chromosome segregation protein
MKLKRLEINGFKSFHTKTRIEFSNGISAIVGPNGCGKSNVVDAIRWAMGEQSAKQLRGKSMDDVIFAGADDNPPSGLAEVSLTLLNDNGTAPDEFKDFTEIQITRRVFRSGETGYFLNKRPCRLKDIHHLFLGSGIGSRSYGIIQQGNIGTITEAGPEERRTLIEEAAGVSRYKERKKEALRKVESTNQNILRINDILSEVNHQMGDLKRQAKKAERYQKIQDRIRQLDITISLIKYNRLEHEMEETKVSLNSLQDTRIGYSAELKKLDAAIEQIKLEQTQKKQEISGYKTDQFQTQRLVDKLENDLSHNRREEKQTTKEIADLEAARKELAEKNCHIAEEVSQSQEEIERLEAEVQTVNNELAQGKKDLLEIKQTLSPLNQKLEGYKKELMDLVARQARLNNIYQTATQNRESLGRRLKRIDEEAAEAEKLVSQLSGKDTSARKRLTECREQISVLDSKINSLQREVNEKNQLLGKQVKFVQSLEIHRKESQSKLDTLKKMEDNLEWYRDGVKAVLSEASENNSEIQKGILAVMADAISPEEGYETAVEAVLGEALQYIIVNDQQTCRVAIDSLVSRQAGRSGFIPVSSIKTITGKNEPNNGEDKSLMNHITVKDDCIKAVTAILGHVVVTENLDEAFKIWNTNGNARTIVTKEGHVISHQGVITGGSKDKLSGILEKKREIKKLEHQLETIHQQLDAEKTTQQELENTLKNLEIELQDQTDEKNQLTREEIDAEKALYKVEEELKSARRHLEIVQLEQDQILGEQHDIDHEMENHNRQLTEITKAVKSAELNVAETSEKMKNLSAEVESRNERVMDIQIQKTSLDARLENKSGNLHRIQEFKSDGLHRMGQIVDEIARKTGKQEKIRQKIMSDEQHLLDGYQSLERLNQTIENTEANYQAIDARLKENEQARVTIEGKQDEVIEKIRYLELEQSQRQMKCEHIAGRIEERYCQPLQRFRTEYKDISKTDETSVQELEQTLEHNRERLSRLGDVNMAAIQEYEQFKTRFEFLTKQRDDLNNALDDLQKVIKKINRITQERFMSTFEQINEKLAGVFPRLFEGGTAKLVLTEPGKPLETGVEFLISPPGKKLTRMSLLSGGEKALSAIAFIFSIFLMKPASFCLLDEIDAPLDEANVFRFNNLLKLIGEKSQIIMITHNKRSMEISDILFGVTMAKKGISKVVSVSLNGNENPVDKMETIAPSSN